MDFIINIIKDTFFFLEDHKGAALTILYFLFNYVSYIVLMAGEKEKPAKFALLFFYSTGFYFLSSIVLFFLMAILQ